MKRISLMLVLIAGMLSMPLFASDADLFTYDQAEVEAVFSDLSELEALIGSNDQITYTGLIDAQHPVALSLTKEAGAMADAMVMPILPAFWWGCLLGPVGLVIVYLVEQDPSQTRSAFWGCFWSMLIYGGGAAFYWLG